MQSIWDSLSVAMQLVVSADADLFEIVLLSLNVSLSATLIACVFGISLGSVLAAARFPGRGAVLVVINALMGLPPVVVGLVVYLYLSRSGPLGFLGLLYTPTAMIIAQAVLIAPIITALSRQVLEDLHIEYRDTFASFGLNQRQTYATLIWEGRLALATVALAGFGRAIAEVGAVMIVGGNIDHLTRVMTTAIALATSRGALPLALGLGIMLLLMTLELNALVIGLRGRLEREAHA